MTTLFVRNLDYAINNIHSAEGRKLLDLLADLEYEVEYEGDGVGNRLLSVTNRSGRRFWRYPGNLYSAVRSSTREALRRAFDPFPNVPVTIGHKVRVPFPKDHEGSSYARPKIL